MSKNANQRQDGNYFLNSEGQFVIANYNRALPFTNFFPGIAGLWGIPMWVFYVNRGQGIASFGIEGKDKAILEFHPANKAYQLTSLHGFRTFLKVKKGKQVYFYEPFQNHSYPCGYKTRNTMAITSHDLSLEETNDDLGLTVKVNYFTLPEEPFAALVRKISFINNSKSSLSFEVVDGLPAVIPFGHNEWLLKHMSRTAEAWHNVSNLDKKAAYYNLKVAISDRPHVTHITAGNFFMSFCEEKRGYELLSPIVEQRCVFGSSLDLISPENFYKSAVFQVPVSQKIHNNTPSAFVFAKKHLAPKGQKEIISLFGHIHGRELLNKVVRTVTAKGFIEKKAARNKEIIDEIKNFAFTSSASPAFDLYCEQTFLDNVLRGGLPISIETSEGKTAINVYSRKHGDPERDYNNFVIMPTYLSQGNGNYRDVNQNRRNDAWFNEDVKDSNIINFLNLIQADGYNPLIIKGLTFAVNDSKKIDEILKDCIEGKDHIRELLLHGFLPGKLLQAAAQKGIRLKVSPQEFLKRVLVQCHKTENAEHGEGFWTDHWTYNLDLIESYLAQYPEEKRSLFLEKKAFSFFHNHFHVLARDERYVLTSDGVRQHHSVIDGTGYLKSIKRDNKLRKEDGRGPIYTTSLCVKLLCLAVNKAATFDPSSTGIEMEADRPNWYDALNGLPGLLGSSIAETIELKRLCLLMLNLFEELGLKDDVGIKIFEELNIFISGLNELLGSERDPLSFWKKSNDIKEEYRRSILNGINGQEKEMTAGAVKKFLKAVIAKTDAAIMSAQGKKGFVTYFTHEVIEFDKLNRLNHDGLPFVRPLAFKRHDLPLFLEGFVHTMRIGKDSNAVRKIFNEVKKGPLFDRKLKMYKVTDDLSYESEEIGRARIFPPGWLEHESIWLHMEYKLLLELLRAGLYKEFFENFKAVLIPFLDSKIYGRSILENSSFIVSSAHEDSRLHGKGFVARLSGTTAELVHIWLLMNVGLKPFSVDKQGKLVLTFEPLLPGWLFTKKETTVRYYNPNKDWQDIRLPSSTYAFNFLGSTLVVYHNPRRHDTFETKGPHINKILLTYPDKGVVTIDSPRINPPYSYDVRSRKIERIDVFFEK